MKVFTETGSQGYWWYSKSQAHRTFALVASKRYPVIIYQALCSRKEYNLIILQLWRGVNSEYQREGSETVGIPRHKYKLSLHRLPTWPFITVLLPSMLSLLSTVSLVTVGFSLGFCVLEIRVRPRTTGKCP